MSGYVIMPIRLAARFQREPGFDPFDHMRPREVIMCRRMIDQRTRQEAALAKWRDREIDNSKD